MATERDKQENRALRPIDPTQRQMIAGVFFRRTLSRRELAGLIASRPGMINPLVAIAYAFPGSLDLVPRIPSADELKAKMGPVVDIIDRGMPAFLQGEPRFAARITEYREILSHDPTAPTLSDATIGLRVYLEAVGLTHLDPDNGMLSAAGRFYDYFFQVVEQNRADIPLHAEKQFHQLGQHLLAARYVLGISDMTPYQDGLDGVRRVRGEDDYQGLVRTIKMLGRVAGLLRDDPSQKDRVGELLKRIGESVEGLRTAYPDKLRQIDAIFGKGWGQHLYRLVEEPGGPDFSAAEIHGMAGSGS